MASVEREQTVSRLRECASTPWTGWTGNRPETAADRERPGASPRDLAPRLPPGVRRVGRQPAACGSAWVGVRFDAEDAIATTRPPARPTASAIAERAAGLIVQLMPAQLSIPSQESTERDPAPSAVIAKPTVSSTSGYSKPPSAAQIPFRDVHLDHHGADENGADRCEDSGREREAADELGRPRQSGGHHPRPDAEALEARPRAAMSGRVQPRR
jgi:hypothetical protein